MIKYSIIIPVYKDINIAKNAILSAARQYRPTREKHKEYADWTIECVIVNDSPDVDMSSLKQTFDDNKAYDNYECKYLVMPSNQGEGNARKLGIKECTGDYFFLMDCDDVYGPDCVSRCNEVIVKETKLGHKISMVEYPFTSFDVNYIKVIPAYSIWVQGRVYNKEFVTSHNIYSTDLSSRAGADYNFMSKLHGIQDYYDRHAKDGKQEWTRAIVNEESGFSWAYWFPSNSQTRECNYWGTWICPKTILNGLDLVQFLQDFEASKGESIEVSKERREHWKHDILNKACYNFINLHDILACCTVCDDFVDRITNIDPVSGEDNNTVYYDLFTKAFLGISDSLREYIDEIWDIDIWCMFSTIWNNSDVHKTMTWLDFRTFIEDPHKLEIFNFKTSKELVEYCRANYKFDRNRYPLHAEQYKKFIEAQKKQ